jgi:SAM-dependent methyltransferase
MAGDSDHLASQRRFYGTGEHDHLRARGDDYYASKLAERMAKRMGIGAGHEVLELGAGFGRFTFHLLDHCRAVTAVDLSDRVLDSLERERVARGIGEDRCRVHCANADDLADGALKGRFDFVAGFFLLHHLPDFARTIGRLAPLLKPGGRIAFLEPNRRNPLYLVQLLACRDMTWKDEKGLYELNAEKVHAAYRDAGLRALEAESLGFFPPQILNRSDAAQRLETRIERVRSLHWVLPFLLLSAESPASGDR